MIRCAYTTRTVYAIANLNSKTRESTQQQNRDPPFIRLCPGLSTGTLLPAPSTHPVTFGPPALLQRRPLTLPSILAVAAATTAAPFFGACILLPSSPLALAVLLAASASPALPS